jgi:CDP-glycerol glycerophosphotransferase
MPNIPINLMPVSLSIIIPVYNVEAYLTACVKSIVSQTFADYEVLLVDDGERINS